MLQPAHLERTALSLRHRAIVASMIFMSPKGTPKRLGARRYPLLAASFAAASAPAARMSLMDLRIVGNHLSSKVLSNNEFKGLEILKGAFKRGTLLSKEAT